MTDHTTCCCIETINDPISLEAAYRSAYRAYDRNRDEMARRLTEAIDERDALKADHEAAKSERDDLANRLNQALTDYLALSATYKAACHGIAVANRDYDEMAGRLNTAVAERDRARDTAVRLEAELARGFRTAAPDITLARTNNGAPETPEAVPREGQEGAGSAPSRAADGLAVPDWHSGTPATGEARKSAESDAPFFAPEIGGAW